MQIDGKRNLLLVRISEGRWNLFVPTFQALDKQPEEVQFTEYVESSGAVVCLAE